ncbi:MAG: PAS domain-containing protein [Candidatus Moduliflexus flocculans]|nr:PAS domain-containing protein [Candidatus Moduliflexus flocculans]
MSPSFSTTSSISWRVMSTFQTGKKAEEAARESEKKYRVLTEEFSEAIFTIDSNHTVIYANTLASRLLSEGLQSVIDDGKKRAGGVNTIQHVLGLG